MTKYFGAVRVNVGPDLRWCIGPTDTAFPAITGHSPNAVSMLGQRRRRWANIETALDECPVFVVLDQYLVCA